MAPEMLFGFRQVAGVEFLEELDGFVLDLLRCQTFVRLVQQHERMRFFQFFKKDVLVQPIGLTKTALEIIAVVGSFEITFGNGNAHLQDFGFGRIFYINQPQRELRHRFSIGEKLLDGFSAFEFLGFRISEGHVAQKYEVWFICFLQDFRGNRLEIPQIPQFESAARRKWDLSEIISNELIINDL